MSLDNYSAQIIGVFFAETVKNVAKGSANLIYNNFNLLFHSEITTLGLNDSTDAEEITKQLEAKPEILELVRQKLNAFPQLAEEMSKTIETSKVTAGRDIISSNVSSHNQSGGQTANIINNFTQNPTTAFTLISLKPIITFQRDYVNGSQDEHYGWQIKLLNTSAKTVTDFRVDIKFPNIFLNQHTTYVIEVIEKRTDEYRLFRTTNLLHNNPLIYPDDDFLVFIGSYSLNDKMRENGDLEKKVTISVFSSDFLIDKVEMKMSELVDESK